MSATSNESILRNAMPMNDKAVISATKRLEYSQSVIPSSLAHKAKIEKAFENAQDMTIDLDYYTLRQKPHPSPLQDYGPKGGKIVPTKLEGLPDMWLCYGAFEGQGCKETEDCVYRHGWFSIDEEVALLKYCPNWLEKARKAWSLNKLRPEFVHRTKVWPFAYPPCHYAHKFMPMPRESHKPKVRGGSLGSLVGSGLGDKDSSAATKSSHAGLEALLKRLG
jgi:hypothetical protein